MKDIFVFIIACIAAFPAKIIGEFLFLMVQAGIGGEASKNRSSFLGDVARELLGMTLFFVVAWLVHRAFDLDYSIWSFGLMVLLVLPTLFPERRDDIEAAGTVGSFFGIAASYLIIFSNLPVVYFGYAFAGLFVLFVIESLDARLHHSQH